MILQCTCKHEEQDKLHGKGKRVYNECKTKARCSVCGHEVPMSTQQIKDKKSK